MHLQERYPTDKELRRTQYTLQFSFFLLVYVVCGIIITPERYAPSLSECTFPTNSWCNYSRRKTHNIKQYHIGT